MASDRPPNILSLRGLTRVYRTGEIEVAALRGIDLDIAAGEMVAVMGPSGSGKSTLMNLLGCLDRPTAGSYFLDGSDVAKRSKDALARVRLEMLGFVFQGFHLLPRTSAQENVELPLIYAGVSSRERQRRAREALARVGLAGREHHHSNQLSGGQQQRVAIARALVNQPRLVLADEPTGNLDSRTAIEVMALLQQLNREGVTLAVVTHEPDVAGYARRVITMRDGRIRSDEAQEPKDAARDLAAWRDPDDDAGGAVVAS